MCTTSKTGVAGHTHIWHVPRCAVTKCVVTKGTYPGAFWWLGVIDKPVAHGNGYQVNTFFTITTRNAKKKNTLQLETQKKNHNYN